MPFEFIFPMNRYGQLQDVYGSAVPAYATTSGGFPQGCGLRLGEFGFLFDGTMVRLLKALSGVNQYDAVYNQAGNGNDYQVVQVSALNEYVVAVNDRAGATPLVANNIAWMTTRGNGTANVAASTNAGTNLVSSATPGYLGAYTPGSANTGTGVITGYSTQTNITLENTSTSSGAYPVRIG